MQDKHRATKVTLYLSQELHRQLKICSAVEGEPMSSLAEKAIEFYLSHSDVVEAHSTHGQVHRIYDCPACAESLVVREGRLALVEEVVATQSDDELSMGVKEPTTEEDSPEEGRLVVC